MYYKIDFNQLLKVKSLGYEHLNEKRRHFTRKVPEMVLYVVTDGTLRIALNGEPIAVHKGEVIIFDTSDTQAALDVCHCEYYWCHFEERSIERLSITDAEYRARLTEKHQQYIETNLHSTESYQYCHVYLKKHFRIRDNAIYDYVTAQLKKSLFTPEAKRPEKRIAISFCICDILFRLEETEADESQHYLSHRLQKFIEKNYDKNLSAKEIESAFSLGIDHLNRICKKATKKSIIKFRNTLRIEVAKEELATGTLSIEEVAWKIGFKNYPYFSRLFKRETGLSPQEYRKLHSVD